MCSKKPYTVLILPAMTDMAGQCRIVRREGEQPQAALVDYRANPKDWAEVGLMNSMGRLVCYEGPDEHVDAIQSCEPLSAGLVFEFDGE